MKFAFSNLFYINHKRLRRFKMKVQGKEVGNIEIIVYKTEEGYPFFYIKPNNESLLPIVDILEDTLKLY